MFNSLTGLPHPETENSTTKVYEEIAYDIKNMIEERDDVSITNFWNEVIAGDGITVVIALDMSGFSASAPTLILYIKFNVVESTSQYTFSV
jgi:tRNA threonylcarbamoyladenosine modification (KEOPS) complex  Pcc1 subunit